MNQGHGTIQSGVVAMQRPKVIHDPRRPGPAPVEFAGQWVAWNRQQTQIIAHATDVAAVRRTAIAAGYLDAIFEKVRRPDTIFVGPT
jgi:hypothetical protein